MFLVVEPLSNIYVFTEEDPRNDGYDGPLESDVKLDELATINDESVNSTTAVPCVGQSPSDPKHFRVFKSLKDCRQAGFQSVATIYCRHQSWGEFEDE